MSAQRADGGERTIAISADAHIGTLFQDYSDFFDPKYRADYQGVRAQIKGIIGENWGEEALVKLFDLINQSEADAFNVLTGILHPNVVKRQHEDRRKFLKKHLGDEGNVSSLSTGGEGDPARHLLELEADGCVASIGIPLTSPWGGFERNLSPDKLTAGCKAVNRWVAEFVSHAPDRYAGACLVPLEGGMDTAINEVRWAKENGIRGGIYLDTNPEEKGLPLYNGKYWDPLWEACADLGMAVNLHSGSAPRIPSRGGQVLWIIDNKWFMSRPLRYFLVGGVFERYPKLKMTMIECNAAWAEQELRLLDAVCSGKWEEIQFAEREFFQIKINHDDSDVDWKVHLLRAASKLLAKPPSEYFRSNVWLSITAHPDEWLSRKYLGVDRLMWGSDYPHNESTWPHSMDQVQKTIDKVGVTKDEIRKIMAANAADVWGFDLNKLQAAADRVGPVFR